MQAVFHFGAQDFISDREHAIISMVDNDDLGGTKQLLGNDQRTKAICRSPTRVADDVAISLFKTQSASGIDARIHAGKYRYMATRRHRQISLLEVRGVRFVCFLEFLCN